MRRRIRSADAASLYRRSWDGIPGRGVQASAAQFANVAPWINVGGGFVVEGNGSVCRRPARGVPQGRPAAPALVFRVLRTVATAGLRTGTGTDQRVRWERSKSACRLLPPGRGKSWSRKEREPGRADGVDGPVVGPCASITRQWSAGWQLAWMPCARDGEFRRDRPAYRNRVGGARCGRCFQLPQPSAGCGGRRA